jgi:hypothetical protein
MPAEYHAPCLFWQHDSNFTIHNVFIKVSQALMRASGAQAQKAAVTKPASAFKIAEAEGVEDLLSLMQSMSVTGAAPQANGDLASHAAPGTPLPTLTFQHPLLLFVHVTRRSPADYDVPQCAV